MSRRFPDARSPSLLSLLILLWIASLSLATAATAQSRTRPQARRVPPDGVQLLSEKAPRGKACGRSIELEYRACKPVASCRGVSDIRSEDVEELYDRIGEAIDRRIARTCRALDCPTSRRLDDENSFDCAGTRRLCVERSVRFTCTPGPTSPDRPPRGSSPEETRRRVAPREPRRPPPRRVTPDPPRRERPERVRPRPRPPVDPVPEGLDLASNQLDCVDPEVEIPPALTARPPAPSRTSPPELNPAVRRSGRLVYEGRKAPVTMRRGERGLAARPRTSAYSSCQQDGLDLFRQGGTVESSMPPVDFPRVACEGRCRPVHRAWAHAHHHVWRARQVVHLIAAAEHREQRSYLWRQPGLGADDGKLGASTSPAYWFGPYSDERLATVKDALDKLWGIFTSNRTGGIEVRLKCPNPHTETGNVCFTAEPSAHHWVKGYVNLCSGFFNTGGVGFAGSHSDLCDGDCNRARLVAHELLHHLFVRQGGIWVAVQDTHYHGHGLGCGLSPSTEAQYGEGRIRHLASYRNSNGNRCGHPERNLRNNDTYAWFAMAIGERIYNGRMVAWPAPARPTPVPPEECELGTAGCRCESASAHPDNTYFEPDGDADEESWCYDHDGEASCVETAFGAGNEIGICTKCEAERGPGCECDLERPCAVGSCFGDDTFGGGVGRCWKEPPPPWACLADCERLYNDPGAYCYYDYPAERGRCMDSSCPRPEAFACAEQGKVCRYGECIVECTSNADCRELGYPEYFECSSVSRCEYAFD